MSTESSYNLKKIHQLMFDEVIRPFVSSNAQLGNRVGGVYRDNEKHIPVFCYDYTTDIFGDPYFVDHVIDVSSGVEKYNWIYPNDSFKDIARKTRKRCKLNVLSIVLYTIIDNKTVGLLFYWINQDKKDNKPKTYEEYLEQEQMDYMRMYLL